MPRRKMTIEEKRRRRAEYMREYYRTHKEDFKRRSRNWQQRHREAFLAYQKEYRERMSS